MTPLLSRASRSGHVVGSSMYVCSVFFFKEQEQRAFHDLTVMANLSAGSRSIIGTVWLVEWVLGDPQFWVQVADIASGRRYIRVPRRPRRDRGKGRQCRRGHPIRVCLYRSSMLGLLRQVAFRTAGRRGRRDIGRWVETQDEGLHESTHLLGGLFRFLVSSIGVKT